MISANEARFKWLNNSNPELMTECIWRIERLVEGSVVDGSAKEVINYVDSEYFEVTFTNEIERRLFIRYIQGIGYEMIMVQDPKKDPLTFELKFRI